jgi:NAD(P)H-hydrate repair Nnr-like enzyme with NAD(P)H-hydrate epimerase domain
MRLTVDGRTYRINLADHSRKLADASAQQKRHFEVTPSGYGIHWPDLDEDLSIDGLIGVEHAGPLAKTAR